MNNTPWAEKYRPTTIDDCVLPARLKDIFKAFVNAGSFPSLILSGSAGVGKTTLAKALCKELEYDAMVVNASLDRGIDILRNDILNFVTTISFSGNRKIVILDEADNLTTATQSALRNFMEEFSSTSGFIMTCNYKNKIIEPLHSRCSVIDFSITKEEKRTLVTQFFKRVCHILETENITYDKKTVLEFIIKYYPDNRKILNELQANSMSGVIDETLLYNKSKSSIAELIPLLKSKKFEDVRKWLSENSDMDMNYIFRDIFEQSSNMMDKTAVPQLILILADYQHKHNGVADQEINMLACLVEIMMSCYNG